MWVYVGIAWLSGEMEYTSMSIFTVNSFLECSRFSYSTAWVNVVNSYKRDINTCHGKLIYVLST